MRLQFFVEEQSVAEALTFLLPKIVGEETTFDWHVFQGKSDLLNKLPARLEGYRKMYKAGWPEDFRIVVLIDEDRQNCLDLKADLEQIAGKAGLETWSGSRDKALFKVLNRIVVEELEAWFFGDVEALRNAFPRIPSSLASQEKYRNPDAVKGGTWEALERLLKQHGYYPTGLPKIEAAQKIAEHMDPDRNRSKSFRVFRDALRLITA